ncbi:hypothetical protein GCM10023114_10850 [Mycolicibacterium sediminis]|uniref:Endonuclease/exonuclease/phosphatase domain-containing protein n=2 Tax=Mycolicibacterium sediminis TaxID=1286180 RepID=A0A7I7QRS7_9MYCO|nr:hypothetical protein MSEDJ_31470 [Mycolicibacterium sediminis]
MAFDPDRDRWVDAPLPATGGHPCDHVTLTTYNVWFDDFHAARRHRAITDLLEPIRPDVMVFQEVTPAALATLLSRPWIRAHYRSASVVGGDAGNYGMVLLTRLPVTAVTYVPLPTQLSRGILVADVDVGASVLRVCSAHLDSGKRRDRLRARQLRRIFGLLRPAPDAVILGDFNMRNAEDRRIVAPYRDVWPSLHPKEPGYTEDTTINHMRYDMKDKHRHVRFDRVLVKGGAWSATEIDLLGTEPVSPDLPRVFPSDHFGIRCRLDHRPGAVRAPRRRWYSSRRAAGATF